MIGTHSRSTRQDSEYAQPRCFARTLFRRFLPCARSVGATAQIANNKKELRARLRNRQKPPRRGGFVSEWPVTGLLEDFRVKGSVPLGDDYTIVGVTSF